MLTRDDDLLKTMISKTKTMKPIIPPPLPYFQALPWVVVSMGAARAREKRANWRRRLREVWKNMIAVVDY